VKNGAYVEEVANSLNMRRAVRSSSSDEGGRFLFHFISFSWVGYFKTMTAQRELLLSRYDELEAGGLWGKGYQ
jgi:hypothetical protein